MSTITSNTYAATFPPMLLNPESAIGTTKAIWLVDADACDPIEPYLVLVQTLSVSYNVYIRGVIRVNSRSPPRAMRMRTPDF